uniref:Agenet domain-containing protein n=1 Tax=Leersia perrieri TaxID=77586 RepID=A0A0D9XRD1_9ORYZ
MTRGRPRKRAKRAGAGKELQKREADPEVLLFAIGAEVEVAGDEPGFAGSFYEVTIEAHISGGGGGYVVVYSTLENDDGEVCAREDVRAASVRPRPPPTPPPPGGFPMHGLVDAFHNGGWWSGVVTGLPRRRLMVYTVAFPASLETFEFEETDLRPQVVFRRYRWVPAADVANKYRGEKTTEGINKISAISEEETKLIFNGEYTELPTNVIAGSGIPSEKNTVGCIDPTRLEDNQGPQESSIADIIKPSEIDNLCPEENLTLPETSEVENSGDVNLLSSDSSTDYQNRIINLEGCEIFAGTQDSCHPLIQKSHHAHVNIMAEQPSKSLPTVELPFVKTSPFWAPTEAMEIFNKIPQRPHFRQIWQEYPTFCEGKALGLMISFVHVAEGIERLNIHDNNSVFEEIMKLISLLEENGFNVMLLRSRLETLLRLKNSWSKIQDMLNQSEKEIAQEQINDEQLVTENSMLSMALRQHKLHAHLLRCIMHRAILKRMSIAVEKSSKIFTGTHKSCSVVQKSLHARDNIMADQPLKSLAMAELPFVKTYPFWAQIEAMEIFSKMPQQPHFHQVQEQ